MACSLWSVCDPPEEMIDRRPSTCAPGLWRPAGTRIAAAAPCRFWKVIEARGSKRRVNFQYVLLSGFLRDDGRKSRTRTEG
jgi:hypothetical protein